MVALDRLTHNRMWVVRSGGDASFDGHLPGHRPYRRVVGALFAAGMATFALLYSTQAVLPELAARFDVSSADTTLTVSLTTLGIGAALLVAGPLSDVRGRTWLIHLSLTASAIVALGCALAPTWGALLALRLLEGVALAGLPAVATAYLREELHPSSHARAAGLYIGGTALGGMAGRLLTGVVAEAAGWRWALAAAAVLDWPARWRSACCYLPRELRARRHRRAQAARHDTPGRVRPRPAGSLRHRRMLVRRAGRGVQHPRLPARGSAVRPRPRRRQPGLPRLPARDAQLGRSSVGLPTPRAAHRAAGRVSRGPAGAC